MSDPLAALRAATGQSITETSSDFPNIPSVPTTSKAAEANFLTSVKSWLEKAASTAGFVSRKDLASYGVLESNPDGSYGPARPADMSIPPAPANVIASGAMTNILVEWDDPNAAYGNHSHAEIWAAETDNFTIAVLVGESSGFAFAHSVGPGSTRYYWVRFVSTSGVSGPYQGVGGELGQTSQDPAWLLSVLNNQITEDQLYIDLNTRIDLIDTAGPVDMPLGLMNKVRAQAGDLYGLATDVDTASERLLESIIKIDANTALLADAGVYTDPGTGNVYISGLESYKGVNDLRVAAAEVTIDNTIADVADAWDAIALKASQGDLAALEGRMTAAEIDVNAAEASIALKASSATVTALDTRLGTAEIDIDGLQSAIVLKATHAYVDNQVAAVAAAATPLATYNFNASDDSWTATNASLTTGATAITVDCSAVGATFESPTISADGSVNTVVTLRIKQTAGTGFGINLQWMHSGHGYSSGYQLSAGAAVDLTGYRVFQWLLSDTADWTGNTITGFRFTLGASAADTYEIDAVEIGPRALFSLLLSDLEVRIGSAEVDIDAVAAAVTLKADSTVVADHTLRIGQAEADIDAANAAITLKAAQSTVTAIDSRLGTAEADINAAEAAILLKASQLTVDGHGTRITSAETDIDALQAEIVTKVENVTFDAADARLTTAETRISAYDNAGIINTVQDVRLLQRGATQDANSLLRNVLTGQQTLDEMRGAVAYARTELTAYVDDNMAAEAAARLELAVAVDDNAAAILSEQTARADADSAIATDITNLGVSVSNSSAAILAEQTARADADTALTNAINAMSSTVADNTAAIVSESITRTNEVSALAEDISTVSARLNIGGDISSAVILSQITADAGVTNSAAAQTTANTAASNATAALASLTDILSDGVITPAEKPQLIAEYNLLVGERSDILGIAADAGFIDSDFEWYHYEQKLDELITLVGEVIHPYPLASLAGNTDFSATFLLRDFGYVYDARQVILNAASAKMATTASAVTTLQTTVGNHTTSISTNATSINGVKAQYAVKIDNNGVMSGYGLTSDLVDGDTPTSKFIVSVDQFAVVAPNRTVGELNSVPFAVLTSTQTINGREFAPGVYIDGASINAGTIGNAQIGTAAIDSAKIADSTIVTAKINDAAITTAKIYNAAITTAKINDAAITYAKIGAAQIGTAHIGDAVITNAKIGDLQVNSIKIAGNSVTTSQSMAEYDIYRGGYAGVAARYSSAIYAYYGSTPQAVVVFYSIKLISCFAGNDAGYPAAGTIKIYLLRNGGIVSDVLTSSVFGSSGSTEVSGFFIDTAPGYSPYYQLYTPYTWDATSASDGHNSSSDSWSPYLNVLRYTQKLSVLTTLK